MDPQALLTNIERVLSEVFQDRLKGVVLYGSVARGDASADSDIDILVLIESPIELGRDLELCVAAVFPISLEWDRPISVQPADIQDYEEANFPCIAPRKPRVFADDGFCGGDLYG